jgi:hypothetical protein
MGRPKGSKNQKTIEREMGLQKVCFKTLQQSKTPQQMFGDMENLTKMVAQGISPSLLITGMPGLGKTHTVLKTLESIGMVEGQHYIHVKGRTTPGGMYITLYENSDKLIIFDDCDSVFKDDDTVNLLKGALDSYDKRVISWVSAKPLRVDGFFLPTSFEFTGRIVFISNLHISKIDSAIRSRAFAQDITLTVVQMIERMTELLPVIEPQVKDLELKKEALEALKNAYEKYMNVELNFRSLIKAIRIRQMGFDGWEDMIAEQVMGVE